jgi:hypothetical protein
MSVFEHECSKSDNIWAVFEKIRASYIAALLVVANSGTQVALKTIEQIKRPFTFH